MSEVGGKEKRLSDCGVVSVYKSNNRGYQISCQYNNINGLQISQVSDREGEREREGTSLFESKHQS